MTTDLAQYRLRIQQRIDSGANTISQIEALVEMAGLQVRTAELKEANAAIDLAHLLCEKLERHDRAIGNTFAMYGAGLMAYYRAEYTVAISTLLNALESARMARNLIIRARSLAMLALICGRLGAQRDGLEYGLSAIEIANRVNDPRAIVQAHVALGNLYNDRDDPSAARQEFESALSASETLGDPLTIAAIHSNLAATAYTAARLAAEEGKRGDKEAIIARAVIESSFSICRDVLARCRVSGNRYSEVAALGNLAELHFLQGDVAQALTLINETYELAKISQNLDHLAYTEYLRGSYLLESKRVADAKASLQAGLAASKQSGYLDAETRIYKVIAQCFEADGEYGEAIAAYKNHIAGLDKQRAAERANMRKMADVRRQFDLMRRRGSGA
jgi:tetratricopeptide (TPR) repeat protein